MNGKARFWQGELGSNLSTTGGGSGGGWLPGIPATFECICLDVCTCCHTEIEVADHTCCLTQSQCTDARPTHPRAEPVPPDAWHSSHGSTKLPIWNPPSPPPPTPYRRQRASNPGVPLSADALPQSQRGSSLVQAIGIGHGETALRGAFHIVGFWFFLTICSLHRELSPFHEFVCQPCNS